MDRLLREFVDTYRLLLTDESLRKSKTLEEINPEVLESIKKSQERIFEQYGDMATAKSIAPASSVIRLLCRIVIAWLNRYGQYKKLCRFHLADECKVCREVFPAELYVKKFDSIVKLENWDLTAAVDNAEKLLAKLSDYYASQGLPKEITENSLDMVYKLRKWAAFEAAVCDGKKMGEIIPIFKPPRQKLESLKSRSNPEQFAQYRMVLEREMSKFETMLKDDKILEYLTPKGIEEIEDYMNTFVLLVVEEDGKRPYKSPERSATVAAKVPAPVPSASSRKSPTPPSPPPPPPYTTMKLELTDGQSVLWNNIFRLSKPQMRDFKNELDRLAGRYSTPVARTSSKRIREGAVYVHIESSKSPKTVAAAAAEDSSVANTQEEIEVSNDQGQQPESATAADDFFTQAPDAQLLFTEQQEEPDDGPEASGIVNYGSDDEDEARELAGKENSVESVARLPDSPDLISSQQFLDELLLPPLDALLPIQTSPVRRVPTSPPMDQRSFDYLPPAEAYRSPLVSRSGRVDTESNQQPSAAQRNHPLHSSSPDKNRHHQANLAAPQSNRSQTQHRRRAPMKKLWTQDEVEALAEAHSRYPRQWAVIARNYGNRFQQRTPVDLKDKVRNERLRIDRATPPGVTPDYGPWAY